MPSSRSFETQRVQTILLLGSLGVLLSSLMVFYSPWPYPIGITFQAAVCLLVLGGGTVLVLRKLGHRLVVPGAQLVLSGLFVVSAGISIADSPAPLGALPRSLLYLAVVTLTAAVYLINRDRERVPLVGYLMVIAGLHVPFALHAMADVWSWHGEFEADIGVFANLRHFGTAGALAAMAATSVGVLSRRSRVSFLLAGVALFGVMASGSRGALVAWLVFIGCLLVWQRHRRELVLHATLSLGTAVAAVLALDRSGLLLSPNLFRRVGALDEQTDLSSGRLELWGVAGQQIFERPWFGGGPEMFWLSECCPTMSPHNVVLSALVEFGIVGCGLLMLMAVAAIIRGGGVRWFSRAVVSTPETVVLSAMLVGFFVLSLVAASYYVVFPLVNLAVLVGLWLVVLHHERAHPEGQAGSFCSGAAHGPGRVPSLGAP